VTLICAQMRRAAIDLFCTQSAAFVVSAAAGGTMFVRWWRLDTQDRPRIWKYYGWFTGLIFLGSCTGAVSNIAWSQWLANYQLTDYDPANLRDVSELVEATSAYSRVREEPYPISFLIVAALGFPRVPLHLLLSILTVALQALRWLAAYAIFYPFTLGFLVVTKLLVLDRHMDFAKLKGDGASSWWTKIANLLVGLVVFGNIAGLACNIAASVFYTRAAHSYEFISSRPDNETEYDFRTKAQNDVQSASRAGAVHIAFETIVLIIIVICISIVGFASARRIRAALRSMQDLQQKSLTNSVEKDNPAAATFNNQAIESGRRLKNQIMLSCCAVFVSFLLRALFTSLFTFVNAAANINAPCVPYKNRCNPTCYNIASHILVWILFTPEYCFAVVFLSQPVTLLVALWGMTSGQTLDILKARN
jgi:hypothetical protein